jgi:tetratricopeptide (TPR) repeat protein
MARTIASRRQQSSAGRFVGRAAEQRMFRATLRQLAALRDRRDDDLTDDELSYAQIFLVAAEGGMGKTSLLQRFEAIVRENKEGAQAQGLYLDLEQHAPIAHPDRLMGVLHDALCAVGFVGELQIYRDALARRDAAQKRAADVEEKYKSLLATGGEGGYASVRDLNELRPFIQKQLSSDEWIRYDDPIGALTAAFMAALNTLATPERPLVLLLDTYELADRCDEWLRKRALLQSNPRLIWVIAGREGQPFIRRYDDAFDANLLGRILLDTFARPEIITYLQRCGVAEPDDELVDRLQALSRGIPLALEGWLNLYRKEVELPPPDPAAPTTRRAIVRKMTDRFLRYCNEDDRHLLPAERGTREQTRNYILTLMLLRRTDIDVLAAAWGCDARGAETILGDLDDQFSFIFTQEIEREPHALVKEFLCEHLRDQASLPVAIQDAVTRLVAHFQVRMRERECQLWPDAPIPPRLLSAEERATLEAERETHRRALRQLEIKIARSGETAAPVQILIDRDDAERAVISLDAQLAQPTIDSGELIGPRRPLWADAPWRDALLECLNALCWADRSGERVLWLLVPMLVEALEFHKDSVSLLLTTITEFVDGWSPKYGSLFGSLDARDEAIAGERLRTILDHLQPEAERWRLTTVQRAILHIQHGRLLLGPRFSTTVEDRVAALAAADEAAQLLLDDSGELIQSLAALYRDVGRTCLRPRRYLRVASSDAVRAFSMAIQFIPRHHQTWSDLGEAYLVLKQYDEAIAAYQEAIALDPANANLHGGLGSVYQACKQCERAIDVYQHAIALDSTNANLYNGLGNVHLACKQYEEAEIVYRQAIALDAAHPGVYHNLGEVYRIIKQYDAAIEAYKQAILIDPDFVYPYNGLGIIYNLLGQNDGVLDVYRRLIEINPDDSGSLFFLARTARQLGDLAQAKEYIDRAQSLLSPDDFYNRACLDSIVGDADAAIKALRIALERGSSIEWAREDPDFIFIRDDPRYRALVGLDSD